MSGAGEQARVPVDYRYDAINPMFLRWMAQIGAYADQKYGAWEQYTKVRLTGEKSPINHIYEHLRCYVMNEPYDHFDGDVRWHLVAVAYNAMMSFYYHTRWGHIQHPLAVEKTGPFWATSTPGITIDPQRFRERHNAKAAAGIAAPAAGETDGRTEEGE